MRHGQAGRLSYGVNCPDGNMPACEYNSRMSTPQRILVTGSAGRIGRAVVAELLARGHAVVGYDRVADGAASVKVVGTLEDAGQLQSAGAGTSAIIHLAAAHALGPRFADPLEVWGEALMRKGDVAGATRKFEEAARYAPRWGRLHLRWGEALGGSGAAADARTHWRAAATIDLSAAERAALSAHLR